MFEDTFGKSGLIKLRVEHDLQRFCFAAHHVLRSCGINPQTDRVTLQKEGCTHQPGFGIGLVCYCTSESLCNSATSRDFRRNLDLSHVVVSLAVLVNVVHIVLTHCSTRFQILLWCPELAVDHSFSSNIIYVSYLRVFVHTIHSTKWR